MITLKYRVTDAVCDTLEALQYEIEGISNALVFMIRKNSDDANICKSEDFLRYEKSYFEKVTEHSFAIDIVSETIPSKFSKYMVDWLIEFETKCMRIRFREEILDEYSWEEILCEMSVVAIEES